MGNTRSFTGAIKTQLIVLLLVSLVFVIAAIAINFPHDAQTIRERILPRIEETARLAAAILAEAPALPPAGATPQSFISHCTKNKCAGFLVRGSGAPVALGTETEIPLPDSLITDALSGDRAARSTTFRHKTTGSLYAVAMTPIPGHDERLIFVSLLGGAVDQSSNAVAINIFLLALAVVFLGVAGYLFFRDIVKPMHSAIPTIALAAKGDLTVNVASALGEVGALTDNINAMIGSFAGMVDATVQSSIHVVIAADTLKKGAGKTADGAKAQSERAAQIASAAEEMTQTIKDIAKSASDATEKSSGTLDVAAKGKDLSDNAIKAVNRVFESATELSTMIEKLNLKTSEIGNIIVFINDIADQTDLLAINAAIEAARAGEHGRGFAVVADEVRKLSIKTVKATAEIEKKIKAVQDESVKTTESMGSASEAVINATTCIREVGGSLGNIVDSVSDVRSRVVQISSSLDDQLVTSEDIAQNIEKTTMLSADIEQMASEVDNEVSRLLKIADGLRNNVAGFKTKGNDSIFIDTAKLHHLLFVSKIGEYLKGQFPLSSKSSFNHHQCLLGKWYDGEGTKRFGNLPSFQKLDAPHQRKHKLGDELILANEHGEHEKVERLYKEIQEISRNIIALLDQLKIEVGA